VLPILAWVCGAEQNERPHYDTSCGESAGTDGIWHPPVRLYISTHFFIFNHCSPSIHTNRNRYVHTVRHFLQSDVATPPPDDGEAGAGEGLNDPAPRHNGQTQRRRPPRRSRAARSRGRAAVRPRPPGRGLSPRGGPRARPPPTGPGWRRPAPGRGPRTSHPPSSRRRRTSQRHRSNLDTHPLKPFHDTPSPQTEHPTVTKSPQTTKTRTHTQPIHAQHAQKPSIRPEPTTNTPMDTTTELQQIRQELDELRHPYKKLAERLIPEDEATPEEEKALQATPKTYLTEEETLALLDEKPRAND